MQLRQRVLNSAGSVSFSGGRTVRSSSNRAQATRLTDEDMDLRVAEPTTAAAQSQTTFTCLSGPLTGSSVDMTLSPCSPILFSSSSLSKNSDYTWKANQSIVFTGTSSRRSIATKVAGLGRAAPPSKPVGNPLPASTTTRTATPARPSNQSSNRVVGPSPTRIGGRPLPVSGTFKSTTRLPNHEDPTDPIGPTMRNRTPTPYNVNPERITLLETQHAEEIVKIRTTADEEISKVQEQLAKQTVELNRLKGANAKLEIVLEQSSKSATSLKAEIRGLKSEERKAIETATETSRAKAEAAARAQADAEVKMAELQIQLEYEQTPSRLRQKDFENQQIAVRERRAADTEQKSKAKRAAARETYALYRETASLSFVAESQPGSKDAFHLHEIFAQETARYWKEAAKSFHDFRDSQIAMWSRHKYPFLDPESAELTLRQKYPLLEQKIADFLKSHELSKNTEHADAARLRFEFFEKLRELAELGHYARLSTRVLRYEMHPDKGAPKAAISRIKKVALRLRIVQPIADLLDHTSRLIKAFGHAKKLANTDSLGDFAAAASLRRQQHDAERFLVVLKRFKERVSREYNVKYIDWLENGPVTEQVAWYRTHELDDEWARSRSAHLQQLRALAKMGKDREMKMSKTFAQSLQASIPELLDKVYLSASLDEDTNRLNEDYLRQVRDAIVRESRDLQFRIARASAKVHTARSRDTRIRRPGSRGITLTIASRPPSAGRSPDTRTSGQFKPVSRIELKAKNRKSSRAGAEGSPIPVRLTREQALVDIDIQGFEHHRTVQINVVRVQMAKNSESRHTRRAELKGYVRLCRAEMAELAANAEKTGQSTTRHEDTTASDISLVTTVHDIHDKYVSPSAVRAGLRAHRQRSSESGDTIVDDAASDAAGHDKSTAASVSTGRLHIRKHGMLRVRRKLTRRFVSEKTLQNNSVPEPTESKLNESPQSTATGTTEGMVAFKPTAPKQNSLSSWMSFSDGYDDMDMDGHHSQSPRFPISSDSTSAVHAHSDDLVAGPLATQNEIIRGVELASHSEAVESHASLSFQIPVADLRDAHHASPSSNGAYWKYSLYKSPKGDKVKVYFGGKFDKAEKVAQMFLNEPVLGFDIEWEVNARPGVDSTKHNVSLIQIAAEDKVGLFQIATFHGDTVEELLPPSLKIILESPRSIKAGVNIAADFTRLRKCLGVNGQGIFELSRLYRIVKYSDTQPELVNKKLVKLADQVQDVLCLPMAKGAVRTSSWSKPLNQEQSDYAATDAYAGYRLFDALEAKRKAMRPMPPRPAFHELGQSLVLGDGRVAPVRPRGVEVDVENASPSSGTNALSTVIDVEDEAAELVDEEAAEEPDTGLVEELDNLDLNDAAIASRTEEVESNAYSMVKEADAWATQHRAQVPGSPAYRATPASLRAYALWHGRRIPIMEVASMLRTPPLKTSTVAQYVLEAVTRESLPFEGRRVREALRMVPSNAHWRYRTLETRMGGDK